MVPSRNQLLPFFVRFANVHLWRSCDAAKSALLNDSFGPFVSLRRAYGKGGEPTFAFEGFEDVVFYNVMAEKSNLECDYGVLVCRGKDRVLDLRDLLSRNKCSDAKQVRYFVDHDFDHLKGQNEGKEIYCTPTYSFENQIVQPEILRNLLQGEFRCAGEAGLADIEQAERFFGEVFGKYLETFYDVNLAIYALRSNRVNAGKIENDLKKYAALSSDGFESNLDLDAICKLTGAAKVWELAELQSFMDLARADFEKLNPFNSWRGKFHLAVFQKVVCILKEDRGRKVDRKVFSSRAQVSANFDGNIVRSLASLAKVPNDLRLFFESIDQCVAA